MTPDEMADEIARLAEKIREATGCHVDTAVETATKIVLIGYQ